MLREVGQGSWIEEEGGEGPGVVNDELVGVAWDSGNVFKVQGLEQELTGLGLFISILEIA